MQLWRVWEQYFINLSRKNVIIFAPYKPGIKSTIIFNIFYRILTRPKNLEKTPNLILH